MCKILVFDVGFYFIFADREELILLSLTLCTRFNILSFFVCLSILLHLSPQPCYLFLFDPHQ